MSGHTYKIIGKRFLREYTEPNTSPVYAAAMQAQRVVEEMCNVPWRGVSVRSARMTYHTDEVVDEATKTTGLDMNVKLRDQFDAALFCAEHVGGQHRAYANAAVYHYTLPDEAIGCHLTRLSAKVTSDPYNSQGARIHIMTSSTDEIPTNCRTCRGEDSSGAVIEDGTTAAGVAPRTVTPSGGKDYWFPARETVSLEPTGGLVLAKHLFLFVVMESYSTVRGNWIEGCSFIDNLVEIETTEAVSGWTDGETFDLAQHGSAKAFHIIRGGVTQSNYSAVCARYAIEVSRNGDDLNDKYKSETGVDQDIEGKLDYNPSVVAPSPSRASDVIGLRALYAKFFSGELKPIKCSSEWCRTGAGFLVQHGTIIANVSTGEGTGFNEAVDGWRMLTSSLVVPFSVPLDSPVDRIRFKWGDGHGAGGGPSNGGTYCFWLKRGEYVSTPPDSVLTKPDIYIGEATNVDGWEFLGRASSSAGASGEMDISLANQLDGRVASILVTAFAGQDDIQVGVGTVQPLGVPVDDTYPFLKPDISLVCGGGEIPEDPTSEYWGLKFVAEQDNSTIGMSVTGTPPTVNLVTSTDGENWVEFIPGTTTITLAHAGDKVYFAAGAQGNSAFGDNGSYHTFTMTGRIASGGLISSLLDRGNPEAVMGQWCFSALFGNCTALTSAPVLPATTLTNYCYSLMFANCTALTSASALPATTLAYRCYFDMFHGCTALTSAPALPATTLAERCYEDMFCGCTALASAPVLPAPTTEYMCYYGMFENCASLTSAPVLPATTMANGCYGKMFKGCASLTSAPVLPATMLENNCYSEMFKGCTALTSAPALPATTLAGGCYGSMFEGCTSLTSAPILPATTLKTSCYAGMFKGCASLTSAPILPATTLTAYCYEAMFRGCTSLAYVAVDFTAFSPSSATADGWLADVAASGNFHCKSSLEIGTRGNNTVPSGWTIVTDR